MTSHDLPRFREMFEILATIFRLKGDRDAMMASYYQAMEQYPIESVEAGYERLRSSEEYWPAPAKWIGAIPKMGAASRLPLMSAEQVRESDEAERLFYEGERCKCPDCTAAHVTHLHLRYVPKMDWNDRTIPMQHPRRPQPVLIGEWIHGQRLRSWYAERAKFYEKLQSLKPGVRRILEETKA